MKKQILILLIYFVLYLLVFKINAEQFNYTITVHGDEMRWKKVIENRNPGDKPFSYTDTPPDMHYEEINLDEFESTRNNGNIWISWFKLTELSASNINLISTGMSPFAGTQME